MALGSRLVESRVRDRIKQRGKFKLDHWPDVILSDATGALDEDGPLGLS